MRRVAFPVGLLLLATVGCREKEKTGVPDECETYLARYDCFLTKAGMPDKQATIDDMHRMWSTGSKTPTGRDTIRKACLEWDAQMQMQPQFKESGCVNAPPRATPPAR